MAWLIKPQRNMCPLNVVRPVPSKEVPTSLTGLKAGDSMVQGVGSDDIVGLEGSIPLEGHGRERGIEDEGGAWPTAKDTKWLSMFSSWIYFVSETQSHVC